MKQTIHGLAWESPAEWAAWLRARDGVPERRERDPLAELGHRLMPSGEEGRDLLEMAAREDAITAAVQEGEDLGAGCAIPGAQGACRRPGCDHALVWHRPRTRFTPCELCPCHSYERAPRAAAARGEGRAVA